MIKFGPSGNSDLFYDQGFKSSLDAPRWLKNRDLDAYEYSFSRGFTISEFVALEKPSILIPSPYVANNHQYKNAMDLVNQEAALIIEEKDLKEDILVNKIDSIINDEKKIDKMKSKLRGMKVVNSASLIYDSLKELVDRM